ncbi:amidohydrolase family protein [Streptomyces sp. NBC_00091]|uniref:amidohydrolase family protein n=1 Tax=Streptomyces sp. NBC_00091 TaxID=2975648 RepID=UPI0022556DEB|nr:amidohydrolase family protein [Streptomyces sp. NBC_00091]MCX5380346.1 amidohydrolase family protein [Streptomyces sp. NBC_00091]
MTDPARVDVHQHLIPPERSRAMADRATALGWPAPAWDKPSAIAMMDRRSIATGVLSYPAPLAAPDDPAGARAGARSVNEYTAELVKDRPDRFGHFAMVDFPYDTARTALHMALNGVPSRYPRIKVILPHAGGFLPYAAHRFAIAAHLHPGTTPESLLTELRRFYFDTAISAGPAALPSLLAFAAPGHVLYGSDFPMLPEEWGTGFDTGLDEYPHWEDGQLHAAVNRGNAELLIPRLTQT